MSLPLTCRLGATELSCGPKKAPGRMNGRGVRLADEMKQQVALKAVVIALR